MVIKTAVIGGVWATSRGGSSFNSSQGALIMWWSVLPHQGDSHNFLPFSAFQLLITLFLFLKKKGWFNAWITLCTCHLLHFLLSSFYKLPFLYFCISISLKIYHIPSLAFIHISQSQPFQLSFLIQDNRFIAAFNSFKPQVFLGELYNQPLYWLLLWWNFNFVYLQLFFTRYLLQCPDHAVEPFIPQCLNCLPSTNLSL